MAPQPWHFTSDSATYEKCIVRFQVARDAVIAGITAIDADVPNLLRSIA